MTRRKVSLTRLQRLTSQVVVHLLVDSASAHNILVPLHQDLDHPQWASVVCLRLVSAAVSRSTLTLSNTQANVAPPFPPGPGFPPMAAPPFPPNGALAARGMGPPPPGGFPGGV